MAEERKILSKHTLLMESRENVSVTGVADVISFDEESIIAETSMGILIVRGSGLHVSRLSLENGELHIDGDIVNITYEDHIGHSKGKQSILGKLFK